MATVEREAWEELWQRGLDLARMAKSKDLTLEEAIETYDRKMRENLSDDEATNAVCGEFMGLMKEEIKSQWDSYPEPENHEKK